MSFVHPGLLFFLALGAIPILVYYLMRFRARRVAWGADYILERAIARRRKKLYWDQIVLLALRALVVMALVTAFARPLAKRAQMRSSDGELLHVVLVDLSYSMLAGRGDEAGDKVVRTALRELVARWGRGEKWSMYVLGSRPGWVVDRQVVQDPADSLAVLERLKIEETAVSLASGLKAVLAHEAGQPREIYIFADDQAASWRGAEAVGASVEANTRIFWIHPTLRDRQNLAVTELEAGHERVVRGQSLPVYARVRNFSDEAVRDSELSFLVDGAIVGSERVSLPPGQTVQVRFDLRLKELGSHLVTARLSDDVLTFDNAMSAGVDVHESVSLLVLRDAERTGKFESSAGLLEIAARVLAGDAQTPPLQVTTFEKPEADVRDLAACDAVVLDGGRTLTPALAGTLQQYVMQGGGLILAADDTVDLAVWRDELGEAGLLPAIPARVHREQVGGEAYRELSRSGFDLPALRSFAGQDDGDISVLRFYTWAAFDQAHPDARAMARFLDGSVYAWRLRFERGCVLLLAAGLNSRDNNLLVREPVYPFLLHLFAEAAGAGQYPRRLARNEPVRYLAAGETPPSAVQFQSEGHEPVAATLSPRREGTLVTVAAGGDRTGPASLLVLRDDAREKIWFGVQGDRVDSDLSPMAPELKAGLAERLRWTEVASSEALRAALDEGSRGDEHYAWVILGVLLFAMGEMLMGLRFV
jgi:hypothetical protein